MRLTFLGTGTSFGVPQIGCGCAVCRSDDPRDRRTRVGALVETDDGGRILIDTPPELRLQLTGAGVDRVDAVLFTHDHADHTHGIDDIRAFTARGGALDVYGSAATMAALQQKFRYIFDPSVLALPGTYKPEGAPHILQDGVPVHIAGVDVTPARVTHGRSEVFAFRVGPLAYVTDAKTVPPESVDTLRGARTGDQRALLRAAPDAPQHPRGDRARPRDRRGAHVPDAPHARQLPRRPRGRAAARHRTGVRWTHRSHRLTCHYASTSRT
jgi:phosphoribosyl 1,2-cyclic phosphate phosphodiesterase